MIPLLGLHTVPPRAEQNWYCKNHLENKGMGNDRPQQVSMRDRWGSPLAQRCCESKDTSGGRVGGTLSAGFWEIGEKTASHV